MNPNWMKNFCFTEKKKELMGCRWCGLGKKHKKNCPLRHEKDNSWASRKHQPNHPTHDVDTCKDCKPEVKGLL